MIPPDATTLPSPQAPMVPLDAPDMTDPTVDRPAALSKEDAAEKDPQKESKRAAVKMWLERVVAAKDHWEKVFKVMRSNIDFAAGFQREGQVDLDGDEYQANLTLRNINQKVASLYAKNPTAEFQRRKRLDFQLWDEKLESLEPLAQKIVMGAPLMPQENAVINDYLEGLQRRQIIDKVGKTLQIAYQYQVDEHDPDFKLQMKSLVRRVCTTSVGYTRVSFARDIESVMSSEGIGNGIVDQARRIKALLEELEEKGYDDSSPELEQIRLLMTSVGLTMSGDSVDFNLNERLVFDFLPSTSVIVDPNCRNLKGFVSARFIAIEYLLPLEEVNAYFECDIECDGELKLFNQSGRVMSQSEKDTKNENMDKPKVCLYEVLDKSTKTHFYLVEGYKDYVQAPEPLEPNVRGFWPVFALTFNDVESDPSCKAGPFPPSDVLLMKHPQKEWNRTRESLRRHRNANAAKYLAKKGALTENDKDKLEFCEENGVIELEGVGVNEDVTKALVPMTHAPIDPACYDVGPLREDILSAIGAQEANIGPAPTDGTATGQSIAEQSRTMGIASNIDDLDDFLSRLAQAGGEILLQEMSEETIKRIVGPGAVWPTENRQDFLNEIFLQVKAASSGRPNKVLELQNWQLMAPILQQAGANPQFMVRETIHRVDDRLDPEDAFPLVPMVQSAQNQQGAQGGAGGNKGLPPHKTGQQPNTQRRPGPGVQPPQPSGQPGQQQISQQPLQ